MNDFNSVIIEKSFYTNPNGFTACLEEQDPSENYEGTYLQNTDAFQRQLKRFDIKTAGKNSDTIEKFFETAEGSALFPEFVRRSVAAGMEKNDILPHIVATTTNINSWDYRTFRSTPGKQQLELNPVEEGATLEETNIVSSSSLVKLKKRGRLLKASYEAMKFQRLDLFSVMLNQMGAYIARTQLEDAIDTLEEGISTMEIAGEELEYSDLVRFWNSFDPYSMDVIIASPDVVQKLLTMKIFADSAAGLTFHASGKMITPFGAKLLKTSALGSNKLIGLDSSCALEFVTAGGVIVEHDKLISNQVESAAISTISGFSKIFPDASKLLSVGG